MFKVDTIILRTDEGRASMQSQSLFKGGRPERDPSISSGELPPRLSLLRFVLVASRLKFQNFLGLVETWIASLLKRKVLLKTAILI
jgi:hypothetical protein